jgi:hypothetical protein
MTDSFPQTGFLRQPCGFSLHHYPNPMAIPDTNPADLIEATFLASFRFAANPAQPAYSQRNGRANPTWRSFERNDSSVA